jgi:hypothetical protein
VLRDGWAGIELTRLCFLAENVTAALWKRNHLQLETPDNSAMAATVGSSKPIDSFHFCMPSQNLDAIA